MRHQESNSEILQVSRASEIIGGMQPLVSNAQSISDGPLIETYTIPPQLGPTPRFAFNDRHVVSIQRDGAAQGDDGHSKTNVYPGTMAICPVDSPQASYTFSDAKVTVVMLA